MKTRTICYSLTLVLSLLASVALPSNGRAAFVLTLQQVGTNVVETGVGTLNFNALTLTGTVSSATLFIYPGIAAIYSGPVGSPLTFYTGVSGPSSFGSGGETDTSTGTGNFAGVFGGTGRLFVPAGYVSSGLLTDSATFSNTTLSGLGFNPGTYNYTWGTGANADSFTVTSVVPEPTTWAWLLSGLSVLGVCIHGHRYDGSEPTR